MSFTAAALAALAPLSAAPALEAPTVQVVLTPGPMSEATGTGTVAIDLSISRWPASADPPVLKLGVMAPGMRDAQPVTDFRLADANGAVAVEEKLIDGTREWRATRLVTGVLRAHYLLPISNSRGSNPPVALRIDGDGFSAPGRALIAIPDLPSSALRFHWNLDAMGPGATGVSSYGDGDFELSLGSIERLSLALFMAGHLRRLSDGNFAAVWAGDPPFDPRPAMAWTAKLHRWMSRFFGNKIEPPYRVLLRGNPQNPGGGAAMTNSFVVGYGAGTTGENLTAILGHEMTHTWTAIESVGKWYSEGNAVYYQTQLPWRGGLTSTADYLADLNLTASRYYTNAMRGTPEDQVAPHFWEDTRIRVLPYDRGALYFAALNGMLTRKSGGKRSIDDLIFAMDARHDAGETLEEADWVKLIGEEIGPQAVALHRRMLAGGLVLPRSDDFGPCFRRVVKNIRQFDLGFDNASLLGDEKIVKGLNPNSEAARAGLRNGDRIAYGVALDNVQADVTRQLALTVTRDGKTFPLTYLPRGNPVPAYQWEVVSGVADDRCRS